MNAGWPNVKLAAKLKAKKLVPVYHCESTNCPTQDKIAMLNALKRSCVLLILSASLVLLSGCQLFYKVDVYQGNMLNEAQVKQLETSMTKQQVTDLIGSPAISDPFHQSRWDYVGTRSLRGSETETKNLSLTFEGDILTNIEGDYLTVDELALAKRLVRRYGNLPRDKDKKRRRR